MGEGNGEDNGEVTGDTGNGDDTVLMALSTEDSMVYAMSQGMAAVVNENTDQITVDARPNEGILAGIGDLNTDSIDVAYIQNHVANLIAEGEDPYGELDYTPCLINHTYDLVWFWGTPNLEWTNYEDIESGSVVSPFQGGSPTRDHNIDALSTIDGFEDWDLQDTSLGEQAQAYQEGQLDVGLLTYLNHDSLTGYSQEQLSTNDLNILEYPDYAIEEIQDHPGIEIVDVDHSISEAENYPEDEPSALNLVYYNVVRHDADYDMVYELLEVLFENRENLTEYHAGFEPYPDEEFWVEDHYTTLPFHPAAADFYEEQGLWEDTMMRYED